MSALTFESDSNGNPTKVDMVMHIISLPWKILFAFVPPTRYWGGWLAFWTSLSAIAILTVFVGDMAGIFGCLLGLPNVVTAISFVALGTSLPDTFASIAAAKNDDTADASVGTVTGSNSVNVFLGLGIPWLISSAYHEFHGRQYRVLAGDLTASVFYFLVTASCCFAIIYYRRFRGYGELGKVLASGFIVNGETGGPKLPKLISAFACFMLWILYMFLSASSALGLMNLGFR